MALWFAASLPALTLVLIFMDPPFRSRGSHAVFVFGCLMWNSLLYG